MYCPTCLRLTPHKRGRCVKCSPEDPLSGLRPRKPDPALEKEGQATLFPTPETPKPRKADGSQR
jgi:hypothetical protein